jgi:putative addiction module component (TIGR02574 family)
MKGMDKKTEAVLTLALDLPDMERAEIAGALLESLQLPADTDVEAAWRDEVSKRVAALDAGEIETIPWSKVRDRLFARLHEQRSN